MPQLQTILVVAAFITVYVVFLLRRTVAGGLDLYDFFMLSAVALIPGLFTFFPALSIAVSEMIGVAFPFVVMFGVLFVVVFVFLHRITVQLHRLEWRSRLLAQGNGLLRQMIEQEQRHR